MLRPGVRLNGSSLSAKAVLVALFQVLLMQVLSETWAVTGDGIHGGC